MPNPCHLRDWTDSVSVNELDPASETFFVRLMMKADDYGNHPADLQLLKSRLYPRSSNLRITEVERRLAACKEARLLRCYTGTNGQEYIQILKFNQKKKWMKAEHPPPEPQQNLLLQPDLSRVEMSRVEGTHTRRPATDPVCPEANIPTWEEVRAAASLQAVPEASAKTFFDHHEGNNLWVNQNGRLINWRHKMVSWATDDRQPKRNCRNANNNQNRPDRNAGTYHQGKTGDDYAAKIE